MTRKFSFKEWVFLTAAVFQCRVTLAGEIDCDHLKNVQEVLFCALKNHPDARLAQASLEQGLSLEDVAGQIPNPELSSQTVWGSTPSGERYSYIELNLGQNFELGGKRGSRIAKARAELEQRRASALGAREQVYISTLLALYRIRQLQNEQEVLKGALGSFTRIQNQFHARPRLNPEQTASLRIFEIAEGDYRLRMAPLRAELDRQIHALEHALGHSFEPRPELLPERKKAWPKIRSSELSKSILGSQVQSSLAELQLAQARVDVAKSGSWPDLRLGPTFESQSQGQASFNAYGLNFSLPLPLFHANGAGRAYANLGLTRAELEVSAARTEGQHEREYYLKRYLGAVQALENTLSPREVEKKHAEIERLFDRGLLSGTLVIEVHRQMLDFTRSQNEQELAAIDSLARFYAYQGLLFEEQL